MEILIIRWKALFEAMETAPTWQMAEEMWSIEAQITETAGVGPRAVYLKLWLAVQTGDIPPETNGYALIVSALTDLAQTAVDPQEGAVKRFTHRG